MLDVATMVRLRLDSFHAELERQKAANRSGSEGTGSDDGSDSNVSGGTDQVTQEMYAVQDASAAQDAAAAAAEAQDAVTPQNASDAAADGDAVSSTAVPEGDPTAEPQSADALAQVLAVGRKLLMHERHSSGLAAQPHVSHQTAAGQQQQGEPRRRPRHWWQLWRWRQRWSLDRDMLQQPAADRQQQQHQAWQLQDGRQQQVHSHQLQLRQPRPWHHLRRLRWIANDGAGMAMNR